MAETTLVVAQIVRTGLQQTLADANVDGSKFVDDGTERTFLRVVNTSGSPVTVTFPAQRSTVEAPGLGPVAVPDIVATVSATSGDELIGPFSAAYIIATGAKRPETACRATPWSAEDDGEACLRLQ